MAEDIGLNQGYFYPTLLTVAVLLCISNTIRMLSKDIYADHYYFTFTKNLWQNHAQVKTALQVVKITNPATSARVFILEDFHGVVIHSP